VKEGIHKDGKYDYGEDEELHVLITGNTQQDVSVGGHAHFKAISIACLSICDGNDPGEVLHVNQASSS